MSALATIDGLSDPTDHSEGEYTIHKLLDIDPIDIENQPERPDLTDLQYRLAPVPREWLTRRATMDQFEAEFPVSDEFDAPVAHEFRQQFAAGGLLWRYRYSNPLWSEEGFAIALGGHVLAAVETVRYHKRPVPGSDKVWIVGNCAYVEDVDAPPRTKVPLRPDAPQAPDSRDPAELPVGCASSP